MLKVEIAETNAYRHIRFLAEWPHICLFPAPPPLVKASWLDTKVNCTCGLWNQHSRWSWHAMPWHCQEAAALPALAQHCKTLHCVRALPICHFFICLDRAKLRVQHGRATPLSPKRSRQAAAAAHCVASTSPESAELPFDRPAIMLF
jgi:hypothetical protein